MQLSMLLLNQASPAMSPAAARPAATCTRCDVLVLTLHICCSAQSGKLGDEATTVVCCTNDSLAVLHTCRCQIRSYSFRLIIRMIMLYGKSDMVVAKFKANFSATEMTTTTSALHTHTHTHTSMFFVSGVCPAELEGSSDQR